MTDLWIIFAGEKNIMISPIMEKYFKTIQIRWSDVDQNRHLRHSAYYDFGALVRFSLMSEHGLTAKKLEELSIGPILFREEAIFRREIKPEDKITVDVELTKMNHDFSRWSLRHNFRKEDGTLAAVVTMDGAWIDLKTRKLAIPNAFAQSVFDLIPKSDNLRLELRSKELEMYQ
jgi:acyl-CoA thioester hydrolase